MGHSPLLGLGRRNHKMKLAQLVAISCLLAVSSSAPQRRRNQNNVNTKFFTGNNAIDSAAWGAALGAGTQYFANQVLNPCRGGNRGGTRGGNQGTNTRFFLGNNNPVGNGCSHPLRSWEPLWLNKIIFVDINFFFSFFE